MVSDIMVGIKFLTELPNCPADYKEKINELYAKWGSVDEFTHKDAAACAGFFRQESLKNYHSMTERSTFASSLLMLTQGLSFLVKENEK